MTVKPHELNFEDLLREADSEQGYIKTMKEVEVLTPQIMILLLRDLLHQIENSHMCIIKDVALDFPREFFQCLCDHLDILFKACQVIILNLLIFLY